MEKLLTMSAREVNRLELMQRLKEKNLSQREAAKMVGVSVRHVRRIFKAYQEKGAPGLVSQRRGRESNHQLDEAIRLLALDLLGSKYRGFGPTLACEKLVEYEAIYQVNPAWLGGCRGVLLTEAVRAVGFTNIHRETISQFGFPSEIISARN